MKRKLKSLHAWFGKVKKGEVLVEPETGKQFVVVGKGSSTAHLKVKDINKHVYDFHNCGLHPYCVEPFFEGEAP